MSDQTAQAEVVHDLSPEQIDKFFEGGGKELPVAEREEKPEVDVKDDSPPPEQIEQKDEQEQDKQAEEEKHARNYQAAMKEERKWRQEAQRELQETKAQQARMETTFQKL